MHGYEYRIAAQGTWPLWDACKVIAELKLSIWNYLDETYLFIAISYIHVTWEWTGYLNATSRKKGND